jgi:hypothetical protein
MKHLDDPELIEFLRENKPVVPAIPDNFEDNFFKLLENEPQFKQQKLSFKWLFPSAMIASLILIAGGYYFLKPSPQIAENNTKIEDFLVNSWNQTIEGTYINNETTPEGEWLMLTNYQSK